MEKTLQQLYHQKQQEFENDEIDIDDGYSGEEHAQDSEGMIMGIGMGNSHITQNFARRHHGQAKNGGNLLGGLNGDNGTEDPLDGDENLNMDDLE